MTLQEYVDSLKGRRIAVLGIGVSNTPLIDLLLKNELPLTVCDMRSEEALGDTAASAEPGVLFWDTIIRESVPDCYADLGYRTVSTNPCGEIPLCPYDSCRLLAINLYSYVVNPFKPDAYFDFDLFQKHVALAQRIMDDIIDLELEKIERIMTKIDEDPENEEVKHAERALWEKIYKKSGQGRRTGVGIDRKSVV